MKFKRWIACGDNHGDMQDDKAVAAFHEFCRYWKPHTKIHMGDCFDLRWLRGKASEGERRERVVDDIDTGLEFIGKFRPHVFITGNHDHRLWVAAKSDEGKVADFANYLIRDVKKKLGAARIIPWGKRRGVFRLGRQKFIHGYHTGPNAPRNAAMTYGSVCMAHVHTSDQASAPGLEKRVGHSSAALCRVEMDYNAGHANTLRQGNGWLYGLTFPNGACQVWHADKINGVFIMPSEMREISGKTC
jgi:hypothetical protein